jgi:hypothetical protein
MTSSPVRAQPSPSAALTGRIVDAKGAPIPGATVTVEDAMLNRRRSVTADESGRYWVVTLTPADYRLSAAHPGFTPASREVSLLLGQTLAVNLALQPVGIPETPQLSAPDVEVSPSFAAYVTRPFVQRLPLPTRTGVALALLATGVNPNTYAAYGSGGETSNAYTIDGADIGDPQDGSVRVFADSNWIQQLQVAGLGAEAEYGGFTGVASNALLRSGTNRTTGMLEMLFSNEALEGTNVSRDLLKQNGLLERGRLGYRIDTSVQIGGPIKRDSIWFFGGVRYLRSSSTPAGFPPTLPPFYADSARGPRSRVENSPNFLLKPTAVFGVADRLSVFVAGGPCQPRMPLPTVRLLEPYAKLPPRPPGAPGTSDLSPRAARSR